MQDHGAGPDQASGADAYPVAQSCAGPDATSPAHAGPAGEGHPDRDEDAVFQHAAMTNTRHGDDDVRSDQRGILSLD